MVNTRPRKIIKSPTINSPVNFMGHCNNKVPHNYFPARSACLGKTALNHSNTTAFAYFPSKFVGKFFILWWTFLLAAFGHHLLCLSTSLSCFSLNLYFQAPNTQRRSAGQLSWARSRLLCATLKRLGRPII